MRCALLAYEMNGQPLFPQHGAPLRLVMPGWYGMTNVKWLSHITVTTEPFAGDQHEQAYRLRATTDEAGTPMSRIEAHALMVPPGIPDFLTRQRVVRAGRCVLTGRAWSGWGAITAVEVSVDGGETWADAQLDEPKLGPWAWHGWSYQWDADVPGEYVLGCRARDATGRAQADRLGWTDGGYANPAPQRVRVTVGR